MLTREASVSGVTAAATSRRLSAVATSAVACCCWREIDVSGQATHSLPSTYTCRQTDRGNRRSRESCVSVCRRRMSSSLAESQGVCEGERERRQKRLEFLSLMSGSGSLTESWRESRNAYTRDEKRCERIDWIQEDRRTERAIDGGGKEIT